MTFHEKLRFLLQDMNRSAVCRRAGVPQSTVNSYLDRGSIPQVDTAVKLAKALRVDAGWLIDPERSLPVVRAEATEPANAA